MKFIEGCSLDLNHYDKAISRQKLKTFANEGVRIKKKLDHGKTIELKMERNLFGKLLYMALERNMDLKEVLKYPLSPVPVSLCHFDGTIRNTPKSSLMKILKKTCIIDPTIKCKLIHR